MKNVCPKCGKSPVEWQGNGCQGVEREGAWYCCEGCAEGTDCTCVEQQKGAET